MAKYFERILIIIGLVCFIYAFATNSANVKTEQKRSPHWMSEERVSDDITRYENAEAVCYTYDTRISCVKK